MRVARGVDARHRRHDDHVFAREQGGFGGDAQALDLLVDVGLLLDVEVVARDVGLRLIVVVVADVVFDGVAREEFFELGVKLRRQRLVVREDQRRALGFLDDLSDGEGFARAGRAEQHLIMQPAVQALDQFAQSLRVGRRSAGSRRQVQMVACEHALSDRTSVRIL